MLKKHVADILSLPNQEQLAESVTYNFTRDNPAPAFKIHQELNDMIISISDIDSYGVGKKLVEEKFNPCILNFANEYNCGGSWTKKTGSQEETLFLTSSLPLSLWKLRRIDDDRNIYDGGKIVRSATPSYPFKEATAIYSPNLIVTAMDNIKVSVVSVAAQDLRKREYAVPFNEKLTIEKIRSILWVAYHHKHDAVVLGPIGCGAFKNDPNIIAKIYNDLLITEFKNCFKVVIFSIYKNIKNQKAFEKYFPNNGIPVPSQVPIKKVLTNEDCIKIGKVLNINTKRCNKIKVVAKTVNQPIDNIVPIDIVIDNKDYKEKEYFENDNLVLFFSPYIYSNWYIIPFKDDNGTQYNCVEQYMMSQKALLFNDTVNYNKIMLSKSPKTQKALGRKVKNFNPELWSNKSYNIVLRGNYYKYSQNDSLSKVLLNTGDKTIAEASPYDKIWGIGLACNDKNALDMSKWKGTNKLGKVLMDVRYLLRVHHKNVKQLREMIKIEIPNIKYLYMLNKKALISQIINKYLQ